MYDFKCSVCNHVFEHILARWTDDDPSCPVCAKPTYRRVSAPCGLKGGPTPRFYKRGN